MGRATCLFLFFPCLGLLLFATPPAEADKKDVVTQADIEGDLRVEATLASNAKVRPGEPIQVSALLRNASKSRTHKVIDPGSGCAYGIVEPHVSYSAVFTPHEGKPRALKGPTFSGMCGMGDYRWHNRVRDLAPGESFDIGARLSYASAAMAMREPGRYAVRVHYAFRRRGTTEKLPQADAPGDLGPMASSPKFEIVSDPVIVHVVRPLEVFVDPKGVVQKGVARRLSDLVSARLENWGTAARAIDATKLKVDVELRSGQVARKSVSTKKAFAGTLSIKPADGLPVIGAGGLYEEAWAPKADGPVALRVVIRGYEPGAEPVRSHWVTLSGPAAK